MDLAHESSKIVHRFLLIYIYTGYLLYIRISKILQKFQSTFSKSKNSLLSITTGPSKIPNHLLVMVDRPVSIDYSHWIHGFLIDCWSICEEYGIGSLTLMDSVNGSSVLLMELVKLTERKPITLYCNHKLVSLQNNHLLESRTTLHINIVTENQRQFFVRQLSAVASEEPDFRFTPDNILSKMTRTQFIDLMCNRCCIGFPIVDLVVSVQARLNIQPLLPSQIGFVEFCHFPGESLDVSTFRKALKGYSQCRQNFGK